jgi:hypothetical protein
MLKLRANFYNSARISSTIDQFDKRFGLCRSTFLMGYLIYLFLQKYDVVCKYVRYDFSPFELVLVIYSLCLLNEMPRATCTLSMKKKRKEGKCIKTLGKDQQLI